MTFTSTPTSVTQSVDLKYDNGSVSPGGTYAISSGNSLTLEATAAGNVPESDFAWNLLGTTGSPYVQFSGATTSFSNGYTTYTDTVPWPQLGIDEGIYSNVRVQVQYPGFTAKSSPTTLTVSDTAPTAVISTQTNQDGSITIYFNNPYDPSASQTSDGLNYSYDFDNNGTFTHDGVSYANLTMASQSVPADMLAQPGPFVVHLRISAQDGTYTDYNTIVTVAAVAPAVTIGSQQSQTAIPGTPFALTDVTFKDPFYATASTNWSFTSTIDWGDGTTSPGVVTVTQGNADNDTVGLISASHLYAPGVTPPPTVQVYVRDSDGNVGTASFPISESAPTVAITPGSEQTVAEGAVFIPTQVYFTDSAAPGMDTISINWGDGKDDSNVPLNDIVEPATSTDRGTIGLGHIYGFPGQYNVTMTVIDQYQTSDTVTFPVNVVDVAPTVIAGPNISQSPGVPVSITSSFSSPGFPTNGNEETYSYTIDWGDGQSSSGTASDTPGSDGQLTTGSISGTHTYASHGNYTVTVMVTDSEGSQGSGSLLVDDIPPAVTISPDQAQTVNQGSPLVVAASFTDPGFETGATAESYPATIDWGDGQSSQGTVQITQAGGPGMPTLGTVTGGHYYADEGVYPVIVLVADDGGGADQATFNASVNYTTPSLAPLAAGVYAQNQLLTVTGTFTEPGIAPDDFVTVNWGDGTVYTFDSSSYYLNASGVQVPYLVEPTATSPGMITVGHTYTGNGPETVTITVTDKDGFSSTQSALYLAVVPTSTSITSSSPSDTSVYGQSVTFTATVTNTAATGGTPTGSIEFYDGTTDLGPGTDLTGSGTIAASTFTISTLTAVTHSITAVYTPTGAFVGGSVALNQVVTRATPTITWTSPAPITFGTALGGSQLDATATWPVGVVVETVGGTFTYTPISGTVLSAGDNQNLFVSFAPADTVDYTAASDTITISVAKHATTTTLSASASSAAPGQTVSFTATVSGSLPAPYLPTGSVQFQVNGVNSGSPVPISASGTAVFSTTEPTSGSFTLTAIYSGDQNFSGSPSAAFTEGVFGAGIFPVGNTLYVVGGVTTSDDVLITPWGSKLDGSTGLAVVATVNHSLIIKAFNQVFTAIDVFGYAGNDTIALFPTLTLPTTIVAGDGNDSFVLAQGDSTVTAGNGNDAIVAIGNGNDVISLGNGNDSVNLGGGNDVITLGNGNDVVTAGDGNDDVTVGKGNDKVVLGNGSNVIVEGNGNDQVTAGNGANLVVAGLGQHTITLGNGNDILIDGSATVVGAGDSFRQILSDWKASSSASVDTRIKVVYNSSHPNVLKAGKGRDWWFYTYNKDVTNLKKTDRLN